jgi:hypothetical protein
MKYRKKPVVIEAMRLLAYTQGLGPAAWNNSSGGDIWKWLTAGGATFRMDQVDPGPAFMVIHTLGGDMRADIGDWIIRGVQGEFYPCKPEIFAATYEKVEDGSNPG